MKLGVKSYTPLSWHLDLFYFLEQNGYDYESMIDNKTVDKKSWMLDPRYKHENPSIYQYK